MCRRETWVRQVRRHALLRDQSKGMVGIGIAKGEKAVVGNNGWLSSWSNGRGGGEKCAELAAGYDRRPSSFRKSWLGGGTR